VDVLVPSARVTEAFDVYQIKKFAQSLTANQKAWLRIRYAGY